MWVKYLYIFPKQVKFNLAADFIGYMVKSFALEGKKVMPFTHPKFAIYIISIT